MTEKNSEQSLVSNSLHSFAMLRQAALEYNKSEYKFYEHGFFKFVRENTTFVIEDIYVIPEFRGTPVSKIMMEEFVEYMKSESILFYYGRVFKGSSKYHHRLNKFKKWGMNESHTNDYYTVVTREIKYDKQISI